MAEPEILPLDYRKQLLAAAIQHRVDPADLAPAIAAAAKAFYDAYDAAVAADPGAAQAALDSMTPTPADMSVARVTEGPSNG
jgi:hypothetical protein